MDANLTCSRCGSSNLHSGGIGAPFEAFSTGFKPDDLKFFALTGKVKIAAHICMDCGAVMLSADPAEVAAIIKHPPA